MARAASTSKAGGIKAPELSEIERLLAQFLAEHPERAGRLLRTVAQNASVQSLDRIEAVWDLSASKAAEVFGVSRQAYAKWRSVGVPAEQIGRAHV